VLCADTTVALDGRILGKPKDKDDAIRMLGALSGQTHSVYTALALRSGRKTWSVVQHSRVTFAPLTPHDMAAYVDTGEPMGKAGAYAIQGHAAVFIQRIHGSHSGIMGLPLYETRRLLQHVVKE
jgi:septum formation protein